MEIDLGEVQIPYKGSVNINLDNYDLHNQIVYFMSSCSCISVEKSLFIESEKKVSFIINSKSDLVVYNEKKLYLYTLLAEVDDNGNQKRNYFETIKLIYR